jgi:hypothetical protein
MDESLVLKQEQVESFQIVSKTYRKYNARSALQISTASSTQFLKLVVNPSVACGSSVIAPS